jgi:uncharacterized membrane protein YvbJ
MMKKKTAHEPTFYCDNCGAVVGKDDTVCPQCGRVFSTVRCPRCGYSGEADEFLSGCPVCGYAAHEEAESIQREAGKIEADRGEKRTPAAVYIITGIILFALLFAVIHFIRGA